MSKSECFGGSLLSRSIRIQFAHRTFRWSNEGRGVAAAHCVIIGFGAEETPIKVIFEYEDVSGDPHGVRTENINPYLVDAPDVVLPSRRAPICKVPEIRFGSMLNDGGNLLLTVAERNALVALEPRASQWIQPFLSADEFINGISRYCLLLVDCPPNSLRRMPEVARRVELVRAHRSNSSRANTQLLARTPSLFGEIRQPKGDYVVVPLHSSENRRFIPIGFCESEYIVHNSCAAIEDATPFDFGVLTSTMHMAWVKYTCGRLESRYRYSNGIVYNNFPWPVAPTTAQVQKIETAAKGVLDARTAHPNATLADLYDPLTMPPNLVKAHQVLDAAVDAAYGRKAFKNDAVRVAFLFELYQKYTSLLPSAQPAKRARKRINP